MCAFILCELFELSRESRVCWDKPNQGITKEPLRMSPQIYPAPKTS